MNILFVIEIFQGNDRMTKRKCLFFIHVIFCKVFTIIRLLPILLRLRTCIDSDRDLVRTR